MNTKGAGAFPVILQFLIYFNGIIIAAGHQLIFGRMPADTLDVLSVRAEDTGAFVIILLVYTPDPHPLVSTTRG